eukprot:40081-Chlamydomonas_euryale.AAC.1
MQSTRHAVQNRAGHAKQRCAVLDARRSAGCRFAWFAGLPKSRRPTKVVSPNRIRAAQPKFRHPAKPRRSSALQVLPLAENTVSIRSLDWDRDRFDIEFGGRVLAACAAAIAFSWCLVEKGSGEDGLGKWGCQPSP